LAVCLSGTAQAALQGRDLNGSIDSFEAYYDTDLNITWLADATLAATNTFGVSEIYNYSTSYFGWKGLMTWSTANSWFSAMNAASYLGYSDWRMPTTGPVNGTSMSYNLSNIGETDYGYSMGAPGTPYAGSTGSEMAFLFYNELGNKAQCNLDTSTTLSCHSSQLPSELANTGPFTNLQAGYYWSGTEYEPSPDYAWGFLFESGYQNYFSKEGNLLSTMVVRDGDIAAVPEPETYAMLLAGLGLLGIRLQSRKATQL